MSITINSNLAAGTATNNLAISSRNLQKSLNRLSSGSKIAEPSDDAGGLAVSMKLTAAIKRQAATSTNIGNAKSFLQTQDGALQTANKILNRISELKTLSQDVTKNASDIGNYDTEYQQLKIQLSSLANEQFNGVDLFGSTSRSVSTSENLNTGSDVVLEGIDLLGANSAPFSAISDSFTALTNFTNTSTGDANASILANELFLETNSNNLGRVDSNDTVSGPFELNLTFRKTGVANDDFAIQIGGTEIFSYDTPLDTGTHTLRITYDGSNSADIYLDGAITPTQTNGGLGALSGNVRLQLSSTVPGAEAHIDNFSISSSITSNDVGDVSSGASLSALTQNSITDAIEDISTFRAKNGSQQSRLDFAHEQLIVNKSNLEAANSRIIDVDIAEESTQLARFNVLMQAGSSMIQQANQSQQIALRLIG